MKIGIEAQRIQRRKKHGMDIVAWETIRHLQQIDKENEYVIFVKADEDKEVLKETDNFRIVEVPGKTYADWEQISLPKACREHGVDLLHCTSNTAPVKAGVPLIVTVHDIIYLEQLQFSQGSWYQRMGNLYRRWNVPRIIHKADRILTVSDFERRNILQRFPALDNKVHTVYNAAGDHFCRIEDRQLLESARVRCGLPERFIFFLGNTDPKKNVPNVLKAYSHFRHSATHPIPLVMPDLGTAYLDAVLEASGDPDLRKHILLTGYIPNTELPLIYNLCTFFLYPSRRESFGIPILEAMQCGKAVITSSTSSMPEIAGVAAILVNPDEPIHIAEAMLTVNREEDTRHKMEKDGLERAKAFSWKQSAEAVLGHYKSMMHD